MKFLLNLSYNALRWLDIEGYDEDIVRNYMKANLIAIKVCRSKREMEDHNVEKGFPYVMWNPLKLPLKK